MELPCGRCIGCRIQRSKEWAIRCMHEAQMYGDNNCFLTLTYDSDHLPQDNSLDKTHFQKFIRSLRKSTGQSIRYYMCGEYGGKNNRPHYHAILFNYKFPDQTLWNIRKGNPVFRSEKLEKHWAHGFSEIGTVTFQSAAYVARYIMKKQNGDRAKEHYEYTNEETGEITSRLPEYTNMSLKPGIGRSYFDKYFSDIFPADRVVLTGGREFPAPAYYRELLKTEHPILWDVLKRQRIEKAKSNPNNTKQRLKVREQCQQAKLTRLPRDLHQDD